jgi:hypothetical protein
MTIIWLAATTQHFAAQFMDASHQFRRFQDIFAIFSYYFLSCAVLTNLEGISPFRTPHDAYVVVFT